MKRTLTAILPLILCLPGLASAAGPKCQTGILKGQYVFTASGFTRPAASSPGTPWVPKAIVEVLQFNGDGTLSTPAVAVANPFGDFGTLVNPPAGGAAGTYSIEDDCSGTVQFLDAAGAAFRFFSAPGGDTIWMIQSNPPNNVFQGSARRVW